ncbi:ABC transporter permease [Chelativorans sp. AA-79]|uniref:ABC transporter permease n=1 Tax=Chelativorans sp. AA-79 TaxID=3028735 RepID=UPI0023F995AD|nr:ABC transporter permease [Chelativorans sp. AA-79]WEX08879.1 ABC transporter permease [Chelativorans sp. AA-79]
MAAKTSPRRLQALKSSRILQLGLALSCLLLFAGIFGPSLLVDQGPNQISQSIMVPPSVDFLFGTDELGRSVLTQIVYGVRTSLVVGIAAAATAMTLGVVMGAVSGYFGGRVDSIVSRITETFQVMPTFVLAALVVAMAGTGMLKVIFIIAILAWPQSARVMRAQVMKMKSMEFVDALRCLGIPERKILWNEILPNAIPPVIPVGTLVIGQAILLEAALAFFGLTSPEVASWGRLLTSGQQYFYFAWWLTVFPGLAIVITVLTFNLVGDALNETFNPRSGHA